MARYNELPVFKDMYTLTLLLFEYTQDFSREYKYTIGQDIKRDALQLIRSIYRANKASAPRCSICSRSGMLNDRLNESN